MTLTAETVPVVAGFHPDPTICRVGEDYYLAHSSFEYSPGVPIHHSRDLVTWSLVGNAIVRDAQFPAGRAGASGGIYAPTLRHDGTRFWLITTDVGDGGGQRLFSAERAEGPWSDAVVLPELVGIDPDLCWTPEGDCLVTYCSWANGPSAIWQAAIDPIAGRVLEEPRRLWGGSGLGHTEGPHLYRRGHWWYLIVAEGGTERGHGVSVARSRDPRGPFEGAPHNPVYTHRSTEHPVQNVGHLDAVERPDGTWAAVHLGVRARGATPGFHVNGRETFLADLDWSGDWPVIAPARAVTVDDAAAAGFDDDLGVVGPRWVSPGARPESVTAPGPDGLEVRAADGAGLYARVSTLRWRARFVVEVDAGAVAHVEIRLDDRHRAGIRLTSAGAAALWTIGGTEVVLAETGDDGGGERVVTIEATEATTGGPDDLVLAVDGQRLGVVDGRYLSTEVAGGFTGRVIGVRVERGRARVRRAVLLPA